MKIEKLPSGSYRIRKQIDGKRVTMTLSYKPGKKEAEELLRNKRQGCNSPDITFSECALKYMQGKAHTLSPSTIKGYKSILRSLPDDLTEKKVDSITPWDIQVYCDQLTAEGVSPKTIHNRHGFISAVLSVFSPNTILNTQLPRKSQEEPNIPSDKDVKAVLDLAEGTRYEIALNLACYGLRRSEICALSPDDLDGNTLTINKALVLDDDNNWIVKATKTAASTRQVMISPDLADRIREKGVIYDGHPSNIYIYLTKCQNKLGLEHFSLHSMRHYYVSTMHDLGVPDEAIMKSGGWKTDHVMKRVYRHAKETDRYQQEMIDHLNRLEKS